MKKDKRVILAILISILCVIGIISSSTYSLWRITKTQEIPNEIVAACLDLTIAKETGTFGISDAWPMSDEEGSQLSGYTFEVKNNCKSEVNYIVGLNALEITNEVYISHDNLKVQIDNNTPVIYGKLNNLDALNVLASKMISRETIKGNTTNTHTIRMWVEENAPITEQSREFRGQVFITGGQGIRTDDSCFTIADNGTILGYDESCGLSVYVPDAINGIEVKEINFMSFGQGEVIELTGKNLETNKNVTILYYKDQTHKDKIENYYKTKKCEDVNNCNLEDYVIIINNYDEYLTYNWDNYDIYNINKYYKYDIDSNSLISVSFNITSLNLGDAKHLTKINDNSFYHTNGTLTHLILPQDGKLTTIGANAFAHNNLKNVELSNTLKNIEEAAFGATNLEKVIIPASVEEIGEGAFSSNGTKVIEFEDTNENPSQLKTIGKYAFQLNNLDKIVIPSSVKIIDDFAFMTSKLNEVYISSSVEKIGSYAFKDNITISKLEFENTDENPSKLKEIEYQAFEYNSLTSVKLPSSLEKLGNCVFRRNNIKIGIIPEHIIEIGDLIYGDNNNLEKIVVKKNSLDGVTVGSNWNAVKYISSGNYTYAPYEFNPNYEG